jgi:DNA-nicking Smr family endonuclease
LTRSPSRPSLGGAAARPELGHGVAPGLDKRTLIKLRRGQFRVEAEIDLHRCSQEQAHRALDAFLAASHAGGRRCVLVITGKGLKSSGPVGVLRHGVPHWLNLPPNRERVLAFCHATPADGGEGALYVLLRRPR